MINSKLHFLFGIALADGNMSESEEAKLREIASAMRLRSQDFNRIKAMFVKETGQAFKILEVSPKATNEEIKKAYKKKALQWHPDRNREKPKLAESKFKDINEAYETLSNSEKRRIYDLYGSTGIPKPYIPQPSPFHFTNSSH